MPFTVITLKNAPPSLRGDLSKWMQEISTGVYVGNFNKKIREHLWMRVKESLKTGEATLSYHTNNEIGYNFESLHDYRQVIDYEGIPLVLLAKAGKEEREPSTAAKFHQARKFQGLKKRPAEEGKDYVVLDIETNGLDPFKNQILEIGLVKTSGERLEEKSFLINEGIKIPKNIVDLTGISETLVKEKGVPLKDALRQSLDFIGDRALVGYNLSFDIAFINQALKSLGMGSLKNKTYDLMKYVKLEKKGLKNYKLQTVLQSYGIMEELPHRALEDAKLTYQLSKKVNKFQEIWK